MTDIRTPRWWYPLATALLLGVPTGATHVVAAWGRHVLANRFTWTSRDLAWMAPLGDTLLLLVPAAVLSVAIALGWRRGVRLLVLATLGMLAAAGMVLQLRGLHPYAVLALAIGLGMRFAMWGSRAPERAARVGRRVAAAALVPCLLIGVAATRREGRVAAGASDRPNVLVLVWDTVRASSTSLHGYHRPTTPTLTALAQEGIAFDLAISPSSWTLPSHGAMFTGVAASQLSGTWRRPLDRTHLSIAEVLRRDGYRTGAFVGNLYYTHHESGVDYGFSTLRDFRRSRWQLFWSTALGQTRLVTRLASARRAAEVWGPLRDFEFRLPPTARADRRRAREIADEFLAWEATGTGPFFAFLNLYDAHDPYEAPRGYDTLFAKPQQKQDAYDAGIRYMDDEMARMLRLLRERGVLDRTVVVVTSDHGEQFGEHGLQNHGNSLYLPVVHVPLVIQGPGVPRGHRVAGPVSLTDLAATIAAATGQAAGTFQGRSLLDGGRGLVLSETEALDPTAQARSPAQHGALSALFTDSLQYIRNSDGKHQLFDVVHDAAQAHNLLATETGCERGLQLDSVLRAASRWPAVPALTRAACRGTT